MFVFEFVFFTSIVWVPFKKNVKMLRAVQINLTFKFLPKGNMFTSPHQTLQSIQGLANKWVS